MKRAASPTVSERATKIARAEETVDVFDDSNEQHASGLQKALDPSGFISGTIAMAWPPIRDTRKLQLECNGGWKLNIEVRGPMVDQLPLVMRAACKIALRGARVESTKTTSAHAQLPFRLVYEDGAVLQTADGSVVDLWKLRETAAALVDALTSPPPPAPDLPQLPSPPAEDVRVAEKPVQPEPQAAVLESIPPALKAMPPAPEATPPALGLPPQASETQSPAPKSQPPPVVEHVLVPSSQSEDDSMEEYTAGSSTTGTPVTGQRTQRRIRKRDTRHSERGTLHQRRKRHPANVSNAKAEGSESAATPHASTTTPTPPPTSSPNADKAARREFDYLTLRQAKCLRLMTRFSTIGVVASCGDVKPTRSQEFSRVLLLTDESMDGSETFFVQCFSENKQWLPTVKVGHVILLRQMKASEWQKEMRGCGYNGTFEWVAFNAEEGEHFVSDPSLSPLVNPFPFVKPTREEIERFVLLSDWWRAQQEGIVLAPIRPGRPQLLIQDVRPSIYFDCVAEVVRTFVDLKYTIVYVSDYTANEQNMDLGSLAFPCPSGKRTLKLALWGEQKNWPIESGPEHYYFVRNVRAKLDADGYLEGMLDGSADEHPCLTRLQMADEDVAQLSKRRADYWREAMKPSATPPQFNAVVRCWHMQQPLYTFAEIKQSDHMLAKFRVRARIVEFYPHKLEDFVCLWCRKCQKAIADPLTRCPKCADDRGKATGFRFRFCVRAEDEAGDVLDVNVEGDDAVSFLGNLAAANLRDKQAKQTLKKRLSIVFGNLIEVHERLDVDEIIKPDPGPMFDFCVQSWAMEGQRAFNIFGCTVITT